MNRSNNQFVKNRTNQSLLKRGQNNGWSGENISSSALGIDEINSGTPFGSGEPDGIIHFKNLPD